MSELYQTVILTLEDGRRLTFTGPAQVMPDDLAHRIVDVKFTEPKSLPSDCSFGELEAK